MGRLLKTILFFLFIFNTNLGISQDIYVYPNIVNINTIKKCSNQDIIENKLIDSIKRELDSPYKGIIEIKKVDLNNDSICEIIILYQDREAYPNYTPTKIFEIRNNCAREIGFFFWENISFAEKDKEFLQILSKNYEGHKTNPVWYLDVFCFDGKSYKPLNIPHFTIGQYRDLGLKAFQRKEYETAEKYYLNAYRMSKILQENQILDANNLALVWIKLKKLDKAKSLLLETISNLKDGYYNEKELAPIYFNLGLIAETEKKYKEALELYRKSNSYESSNARLEKIKLMTEK